MNPINPAQVITTYFYINFNIILTVSAYVYEVIPSVLLPKILYIFLISPMILWRSEHSNQFGIQATIYALSHCLYCSGTFSSLSTNIPFSKPSPFSDRALGLAVSISSCNVLPMLQTHWFLSSKASIYRVRQKNLTIFKLK